MGLWWSRGTSVFDAQTLSPANRDRFRKRTATPGIWDIDGDGTKLLVMKKPLVRFGRDGDNLVLMNNQLFNMCW